MLAVFVLADELETDMDASATLLFSSNFLFSVGKPHVRRAIRSEAQIAGLAWPDARCRYYVVQNNRF